MDLEKIIGKNIEIMIKHAMTLLELNLISESINEYEEIYKIDLKEYKTKVSKLKGDYFRRIK